MVEHEPRPSLEKALASTQADIESALKLASSVAASLRKVRSAAATGNLRDLRPALLSAEQAITALRQQFANAREGWDFDEEGYLSSDGFPSELIDAGSRAGIRIFEQDDRLYSYPALIRVLPKDRAVLIDKTRARKLRPTVLVNQLKELQKRPPRFRPEPFLESLFEAYSTLVAKRGKGLFSEGRVETLLAVYKLLTLLPDQSREYSRQEFGRDIYLLDRSGVSRTRGGMVVSFPASTATRSPSSTVRIITEEGTEKVYYGIQFSAGG